MGGEAGEGGGARRAWGSLREWREVVREGQRVKLRLPLSESSNQSVLRLECEERTKSLCLTGGWELSRHTFLHSLALPCLTLVAFGASPSLAFSSCEMGLRRQCLRSSRAEVVLIHT